MISCHAAKNRSSCPPAREGMRASRRRRCDVTHRRSITGPPGERPRRRKRRRRRDVTWAGCSWPGTRARLDDERRRRSPSLHRMFSHLDGGSPARGMRWRTRRRSHTYGSIGDAHRAAARGPSIPANVNARRSVATCAVSFLPAVALRNGSSRSYLDVLIESTTKVPVEPVGAVCGVQGVAGNAPSGSRQSPPGVSPAFSQHRQDPQAARARRERRGCRRRDAHVVSFWPLAGPSCVRRIERPFRSMRCASWSRRSQMASA